MKNELLKGIGQRIKERRLLAGFQQGELAKAFGCAQSRISGIESGSRDPGVDFIVWFAQTTGVSTDYILLGEEIPRREIVEDFGKYVCDHVFKSMKLVAINKSFIEKIEKIVRTEMLLNGPNCFWLNSDEEQLIVLIRKSPEKFKRIYNIAASKEQTDNVEG
jgi:transcriptional regulator with XRE-family HTH domain